MPVHASAMRCVPILILLLLAVPLFGTAVSAAEPLAADTQTTTVLGNPFIAPAGWIVTVRGPATIVVGSGEKRSLIVRDAQHEYVFDAK